MYIRISAMYMSWIFFTFLISKYFGINIASSGEYLSRFLKQTSLIKMAKCDDDDELRV